MLDAVISFDQGWLEHLEVFKRFERIYILNASIRLFVFVPILFTLAWSLTHVNLFEMVTFVFDHYLCYESRSLTLYCIIVSTNFQLKILFVGQLRTLHCYWMWVKNESLFIHNLTTPSIRDKKIETLSGHVTYSPLLDYQDHWYNNCQDT